MNNPGGSNKNLRLLVIDDDPQISQLLNVILKSEGFIIQQAFDGSSGLKMAYETQPDLIILDIMMPTMDGLEVCQRLREMTNTPILMLTALSRESDTLRGFSAGADDYVKKPFKNEELVARVNALLRRNQEKTGYSSSKITQYNDGYLSVDLESRNVKLGGKNIELSSLEYDLLACLVRNTNKTVSHRQILDEVWGKSYGDLSSSVTLYVFYLRKKLKDSKHGHQYIHTQWGRGYIFIPRNQGQ